MTDQANQSRRNFLYVAAGGLGAVAAGATVVPFIGSMLPAADTLAASKTEFDVSTVEAGQLVVIQWQGKPVFVVNRTAELLAQVDGHDDRLKDVNSEAIPEVQQDWMDTPEKRKYRAIKPEYLIVVASCTHLGCIPLFKPTQGRKDWGDSVPENWAGGWHCPCHGSYYDISARVVNGSPAPHNLHVMPYKYTSDTKVVIG
ncbi:ubiquinol-cytochrome c reductase iron-sulfur subunit [Mariprofundus micogutta]|uniref:Ubiquinol-cytochrome c reductase iron-sulfur subunit n=1 Tax=Mariprofundus micogutta TaxID=1921010 RepID=A0A1L8CNS7_9PROT|nr:ubiquinol-cytochrome c reductase iron-sulfur subunit [Mariprofundus micogutta]GAV20571.1 ubiquinol-cytochrome c reductase iron-sulfur subunit [Mariprofundus micogutta]